MKIINLESLNENFNEDTDFILEITEEYSKLTETSIEKLLQSYNNNDWEEMLCLVHSLKGSSKTIYAEEISELFVNLENRLKDKKNKDLEEIIVQIVPAFNRLKHFIGQLHER